MENPDLTGNERFGVAMNYGNFEGASALSWAGMGVLGYDVLSRGDRVAISGGFGVGFARTTATTSGAAASALSGLGATSRFPTS